MIQSILADPSTDGAMNLGRRTKQGNGTGEKEGRFIFSHPKTISLGFRGGVHRPYSIPGEQYAPVAINSKFSHICCILAFLSSTQSFCIWSLVWYYECDLNESKRYSKNPHKRTSGLRTFSMKFCKQSTIYISTNSS